MVEEYRGERCRQLDELEDGRPIDERAAAGVIVFKAWLRHYPWTPREVIEAWSRPHDRVA